MRNNILCYILMDTSIFSYMYFITYVEFLLEKMKLVIMFVRISKNLTIF